MQVFIICAFVYPPNKFLISEILDMAGGSSQAVLVDVSILNSAEVEEFFLSINFDSTIAAKLKGT